MGIDKEVRIASLGISMQEESLLEESCYRGHAQASPLSRRPEWLIVASLYHRTELHDPGMWSRVWQHHGRSQRREEGLPEERLPHTPSPDPLLRSLCSSHPLTAAQERPRGFLVLPQVTCFKVTFVASTLSLLPLAEAQPVSGAATVFTRIPGGDVTVHNTN